MSNKALEETKNICKFFFKSVDGCRHGDKCKFSHDYNKKKPKNTENFIPSFKPADMNIYVGIPQNKVYGENDIIIIPNFINEIIEKNTYLKLLEEVNSLGIENNQLWKLWHGDTHFIANDHVNWKDKVPTFKNIIDQIADQFKIKIRSSRFNLYKNSNDWKPFHHDAAAIKDHIAAIQNITIGISLGATREISFEHAKTKNTVSFNLPNGFAYAFTKNININWKHGIPKIDPTKYSEEGRISIIVWGQYKE